MSDENKLLYGLGKQTSVAAVCKSCGAISEIPRSSHDSDWHGIIELLHALSRSGHVLAPVSLKPVEKKAEVSAALNVKAELKTLLTPRAVAGALDLSTPEATLKSLGVHCDLCGSSRLGLARDPIRDQIMLKEICATVHRLIIHLDYNPDQFGELSMLNEAHLRRLLKQSHSGWVESRSMKLAGSREVECFGETADLMLRSLAPTLKHLFTVGQTGYVVLRHGQEGSPEEKIDFAKL